VIIGPGSCTLEHALILSGKPPADLDTSENTGLPAVTLDSHGLFVPYQFWVNSFSLTVGEHFYTSRDYEAYALSKIWNITEAARNGINERLAALAVAESDLLHSATALHRPLCAVHVRRGDKSSEAPPVPVTKYLEKIVSSGVNCKTMFVASDAMDQVVGEIKAALSDTFPDACQIPTVVNLRTPTITGTGHEQAAFRNLPEEVQVQQTLNMLTEWEVMRAADILVCTLSSNVGRIAALLRDHYGWTRDTLYSVDMDWVAQPDV